MTEVEKLVVSRIVNTLTAMGASFAILTKDGQKHGDLDVVLPNDKKPRRKRKDYSSLELDSKIGAMKVADVNVFATPDGITVDELQSVVSARGYTAFGRGNFTTTRVGNTVQCMRVA